MAAKPLRRIPLTDLNAHLICVLCKGYFVDATTVIECLHSFCKSCIVRYLDTSSFCPVCDVQVHKTRPLVSLREDRTLQDVVYKLVPGLFEAEMDRRLNFYHDNPDAVGDRTEQTLREKRHFFHVDDQISLSMEYLPPAHAHAHALGLRPIRAHYATRDCPALKNVSSIFSSTATSPTSSRSTSSSAPATSSGALANGKEEAKEKTGEDSIESERRGGAAGHSRTHHSLGTLRTDSLLEMEIERQRSEEEAKASHRRYLKCPAAATISLLEKFIRLKYNLSMHHKVDIMHTGDCLAPELTLLDVVYMYKWNEDAPLKFLYTVLAPPTVPARKRIKCVHPTRPRQPTISAADVKTKSLPPSHVKSPTGKAEPKLSPDRKIKCDLNKSVGEFKNSKHADNKEILKRKSDEALVDGSGLEVKNSPVAADAMCGNTEPPKKKSKSEVNGDVNTKPVLNGTIPSTDSLLPSQSTQSADLTKGNLNTILNNKLIKNEKVERSDKTVAADYVNGNASSTENEDFMDCDNTTNQTIDSMDSSRDDGEGRMVIDESAQFPSDDDQTQQESPSATDSPKPDSESSNTERPTKPTMSPSRSTETHCTSPAAKTSFTNSDSKLSLTLNGNGLVRHQTDLSLSSNTSTQSPCASKRLLSPKLNEAATAVAKTIENAASTPANPTVAGPGVPMVRIPRPLPALAPFDPINAVSSRHVSPRKSSVPQKIISSSNSTGAKNLITQTSSTNTKSPSIVSLMQQASVPNPPLATSGLKPNQAAPTTSTSIAAPSSHASSTKLTVPPLRISKSPQGVSTVTNVTSTPSFDNPLQRKPPIIITTASGGASNKTPASPISTTTATTTPHTVLLKHASPPGKTSKSSLSPDISTTSPVISKPSISRVTSPSTASSESIAHSSSPSGRLPSTCTGTNSGSLISISSGNSSSNTGTTTCSSKPLMQCSVTNAPATTMSPSSPTVALAAALANVRQQQQQLQQLQQQQVLQQLQQQQHLQEKQQQKQKALQQQKQLQQLQQLQQVAQAKAQLDAFAQQKLVANPPPSLPSPVAHYSSTDATKAGLGLLQPPYPAAFPFNQRPPFIAPTKPRLGRPPNPNKALAAAVRGARGGGRGSRGGGRGRRGGLVNGPRVPLPAQVGTLPLIQQHGQASTQISQAVQQQYSLQPSPHPLAGLTNSPLSNPAMEIATYMAEMAAVRSLLNYGQTYFQQNQEPTTPPIDLSPTTKSNNPVNYIRSGILPPSPSHHSPSISLPHYASLSSPNPYVSVTSPIMGVVSSPSTAQFNRSSSISPAEAGSSPAATPRSAAAPQTVPSPRAARSPAPASPSAPNNNNICSPTPEVTITKLPPVASTVSATKTTTTNTISITKRSGISITPSSNLNSNDNRTANKTSNSSTKPLLDSVLSTNTKSKFNSSANASLKQSKSGSSVSNVTKTSSSATPPKLHLSNGNYVVESPVKHAKRTSDIKKAIATGNSPLKETGPLADTSSILKMEHLTRSLPPATMAAIAANGGLKY